MSTSLHRVIIYHDETKDVPGRNYKGHVLLFVPVSLSVESETPLLGTFHEEYSPQEMFFAELMHCRQEFACADGKLHFSELSGKTWKKYDYAYHKAITLAVDALRSKSPQIFSRSLCCKVAAIFYPKGADWNIYGGDSRKEQKLRHDETLLRILLKGACHYLYGDANSVEVVKIVSDGNPAHRMLDDERVVWRLTYDDLYGKSPLRDYVTFAPSASIVHLSSSHKDHQPDTEEYKHANFLQVADLLLGAIMRACYVGTKPVSRLPKIGELCSKRDVIAQPVKEMLDKRKRGSGFRHSGHYKSFAITQVAFSKDGIHFQEVQSVNIQDDEFLQISLFHQ